MVEYDKGRARNSFKMEPERAATFLCVLLFLLQESMSKVFNAGHNHENCMFRAGGGPI